VKTFLYCLEKRKALTFILILFCVVALLMLSVMPALCDAILLGRMEENWQTRVGQSPNADVLSAEYDWENQPAHSYDRFLVARTLWNDAAKEIPLKTDSSLAVCRWDKLKFKPAEGEGTFTPIGIAGISDMEKWIRLSDGRFPETGERNGGYEVMIPEEELNTLHMTLGEEYQVADYQKAVKEPFLVRIVGTYRLGEEAPSFLEGACRGRFLVGEETLSQAIAEDFRRITGAGWYFRFSGENASVNDLGNAKAWLEDRYLQCQEAEDAVMQFPMKDLLEDFCEDLREARRYTGYLLVALEAVLACILMACSHAVLRLDNKNRQLSGNPLPFRKKLPLYLAQNFLLAVLAALTAWLLVKPLVHLFGAYNEFCALADREIITGAVKPVPFPGWACAGLFVLLTVPVLVRPLTSRAEARTGVFWRLPLWEQLPVDLLCIGLGVYGLQRLRNGQTPFSFLPEPTLLYPQFHPWLVPLLILCIVGFVLLFLRVLYGTAFCAERISGGKIHPTKALETGRLCVFCLAFALLAGITVYRYADRIHTEAEKDLRQIMPVDAITGLAWPCRFEGSANSLSMDGSGVWIEPDFGIALRLDGVEKAARVYHTNGMEIIRREDIQGEAMLFYPREYGEVLEDLSPEVQLCLEQMEANPKGVYVSEAFRDELGCQEGEIIQYHVLEEDSPYNFIRDGSPLDWSSGRLIEGEILGFLPSWPGMDPGSPYFLAGNWLFWEEQLKPLDPNQIPVIHPYEYYLKTVDGVTTEQLLLAIEESSETDVDSNRPPVTYVQLEREQVNFPLNQVVTSELTCLFLALCALAIISMLFCCIYHGAPKKGIVNPTE